MDVHQEVEEVMEEEPSVSGSVERGAMGTLLQPVPAIGMGDRATHFHTLMSDDVFEPSTSDHFYDTPLPRSAGETGSRPDTADDRLGGSSSPPTSLSMHASASPAQAPYYVGGPCEDVPSSGPSGASPLASQGIHADDSTRCGLDLAPAFPRPPSLPPANRSPLCSDERSVLAKQHSTALSSVDAYLHADFTTPFGRGQCTAVGGNLHVSTLTPAAASPFYPKPGGSGRSTLLAFRALLSIVLVLGLCGCSESLHMTHSEGDLISSIAARYDVFSLERHARGREHDAFRALAPLAMAGLQRL